MKVTPHIIKLSLLFTAIIATVIMFLFPAIKQDELYHHFSDVHTHLNIPNALNVLSNLPFIIIGIIGAIWSRRIQINRILYMIFFVGIALVGVGSGYYHILPNSITLVWDRLPMTVAFMSLFSIVISEFIDEKLGKQMFIPLLIAGLFSIYFWVTFQDLRLYALVQFYPILMIPFVLLFSKSKYSKTGYWLLLLMYGIAKVLEHFDAEIYSTLKLIGGHPLKHIASAIGIFLLLQSYQKRKS